MLSSSRSTPAQSSAHVRGSSPTLFSFITWREYDEWRLISPVLPGFCHTVFDCFTAYKNGLDDGKGLKGRLKFNNNNKVIPQDFINVSRKTVAMLILKLLCERMPPPPLPLYETLRNMCWNINTAMYVGEYGACTHLIVLCGFRLGLKVASLHDEPEFRG